MRFGALKVSIPTPSRVYQRPAHPQIYGGLFFRDDYIAFVARSYCIPLWVVVEANRLIGRMESKSNQSRCHSRLSHGACLDSSFLFPGSFFL